MANKGKREIREYIAPSEELYTALLYNKTGSISSLKKYEDSGQTHSLYKLGYLRKGVDSAGEVRYQVTNKGIREAEVFCALDSLKKAFEKVQN